MNSYNKTEDWKLFEAGKNYNNKLTPNYYDTVSANIDFFAGNQWRGAEVEDLPKPVFNFIKRAITYFVASLTSSNISLQLTPLEYSDNESTPEMDAADMANAEIRNIFEKIKIENRVRDALFKAGVMGDVAAHGWFDRNKKPYRGMFKDGAGKLVQGEICFELVNGTNIMLGNANNPTISKEVQPYVMVIGRDTVANLKREAKQYKAETTDIDGITSDRNYETQAGEHGMIEVEVDIDGDEYGKALYVMVYKYDHDTQTIKVSKCTESSYMYKDVDTGLDDYPVAWLVWEKQENQYHGRAVCTGLMPNQIFINRMFAMVMYHLMMSAFPKAIYDADKINGWTNEIGIALPMKNLMPGDNVKNFAGYLEPGNMSSQIVQVIEMAIRHTKESLGLNDAALGNVDPEQASGVSIAQTVKQSSIPLENVKANLYEWIEDIGRILIDLMGTYYGNRPVVIKGENGTTVQWFDFSQLKNMWLNIRADVGASTYWSEIAQIQTLDNLLESGKIEFIDYLERIPDMYIPKKQELIQKIRQAMEQQQAMQGQQVQYEQMAQFVESLPPEQQAQLEQLRQQNPTQYEQVVLQMMGGGMGS
jgi:hypothetical protein